ncbi:MAG: SsrA-binding protein SmpB [Bdellovibrionales bacterium]
MSTNESLIHENREARFHYEILETLEAGLVLTGSEVKSLRGKNVRLKDSFVVFVGSEAFIQNSHIAPYKFGSYANHEPERKRKLLLHQREIDHLHGSVREKGLTCIPLKLYFKSGRVKVLIGLAKGKKLHDKRETLKKRDADLALRQSLKKTR